MKLTFIVLCVFNYLNINLLTSQNNCWKSISSGDQFVLAVREDGTLWAWGANNYGQLGNGSKLESSTPMQVGNENNWTRVIAGPRNSFAFKNDNSLWGWGDNANYQLGIGHNQMQLSPVLIGYNWKVISPATSHTLAIRNDGTLWGWGNNSNLQLGVGLGTPYSAKPIPIDTLERDWTSVSAGVVHSAGIKSGRNLRVWGEGGQGQLGRGNYFSSSIPVQVGGDGDWYQVSCGYDFTLAIKQDLTLWGWGLGTPVNGSGQNFSSPKQLSLDKNWNSIDAGFWYSLALKRDSTLWAWGRNEFGQLGLGNFQNIPSPTLVDKDLKWVQITSGGIFSSGLLADKRCMVWGDNTAGNLGNGTDLDSNIPIIVSCNDLTTQNDLNKNDNLTIFPNPTNGRIYFSRIVPDGTISIFNLQNQLIVRLGNNNKDYVDLEQLEPGVYILRMESGFHNWFVKILKNI